MDEHPAVRECAVVGLPDDDLGQQIAALIAVESPSATTEQELAEFAKQRIVGPKRDRQGRARHDRRCHLRRRGVGSALR